jgi:ribosomal-protein-alanine N-acetyltransferase
VTIRQTTLADLPAIAALHAQCFVDAWSEEFLRRLLSHPNASGLLIEDSGEASGFVLIQVTAGESEILSLGVRPDARRSGLGTLLVKAAAERAALGGASEIFLEVSVENAHARALYEKLGFRHVGKRPGYYRAAGSVTDALVFRRGLPL